MHVDLVHWPAETDRLEALRTLRRPRLILVEQGEPPVSDDCLEDWLRVPVDELELRTRRETLESRALRHGAAVSLDDGLLRHDGRAIPLAPVQMRLLDALLERRDAVVSRETLVRKAWPGAAPRHRNVLDVHIARLRRAIAPAGLEIRTVRRRGYLLQTAAEAG
jgi:DNA-binding response OmpR family regulator